MSPLVAVYDTIPLADSREIAEKLGVKHRSFFKLITDYQEEIELDFGVVRFEIAKPPIGSQGGRPERYALLTEDQTYVLMMYTQNTDQARSCKRLLVKAFAEAKQQLAQGQLDMIEQITHLEERIKGLHVRLVEDVDREVISVVVQRPDIIEIKAFFEKVEAQVKQLQNAIEVDAEANEQMLELYGFTDSVLEAVEQNRLATGKDVKLLKAKKDEW